MFGEVADHDASLAVGSSQHVKKREKKEKSRGSLVVTNVLGALFTAGAHTVEKCHCLGVNCLNKGPTPSAV